MVDSRVIDPFDPNRSWSVEALRGPEGLRRWTNDDVVPRPGDVFQERLYCIRWIDAEGKRRYAAPDEADLAREAKVLELLRERFADWQREGFIPSKAIPEGGDKTEQPIRERGWTHWHHLFTPRQLLTHGLLAEICGSASSIEGGESRMLAGTGADGELEFTAVSLDVSTSANEKGDQTFSTIKHSTRFSITRLGHLPSLTQLGQIFRASINASSYRQGHSRRLLTPATSAKPATSGSPTRPTPTRSTTTNSATSSSPGMTSNSPALSPSGRPMPAPNSPCAATARTSAVPWWRSTRTSPATCRTTACRWCMFTHQDPAVWADLGMILWAAGLKATAAWTISTETEAVGIKKGNYVQGTVCLVLRKRTRQRTRLPRRGLSAGRGRGETPDRLHAGARRRRRTQLQRRRLPARRLRRRAQGAHPIRHPRRQGRGARGLCRARPGTRRATSRPSSNAPSASPATRSSRAAWTPRGAIFRSSNATTSAPSTSRAAASAAKACMKNWPAASASPTSGRC